MGGSYSAYADSNQPGVEPIVSYLKSLPRPIDPRCEEGHYYLLNNYNPGYFGNGNNAYTDTSRYEPPKNCPALWKDTAIFVTFDEGGGYYDSGYVQPLDFFGDGTRIPMIVVSPYTKPGHIAHDYSDHVSILKFIERNWHLGPVTNRSRDNFPNPIAAWGNPYAPVNTPAISDLFELFDWDQCRL